MTPRTVIVLFVVVAAAALLANLLALKIAADQASAQLDTLKTQSGGLLGLLLK